VRSKKLEKTSHLPSPEEENEIHVILRSIPIISTIGDRPRRARQTATCAATGPGDVSSLSCSARTAQISTAQRIEAKSKKTNSNRLREPSR